MAWVTRGGDRDHWVANICVRPRSELPPVQEGYPMREWSIKIVVLGPNGEELPATMFDKVTYRLHPTFHNPNRSTFIWI